jgi:hypothetical protein
VSQVDRRALPQQRASWETHEVVEDEVSVVARPSCDARDMADFTVETTNGVVTSYSGVEARHDLNAQSGVLVVWDGKGKRLKFSPCGWLSVVDEDQAIAPKHQGVETV